MSYIEKVKSSCRQDEDIVGHKFRYNKDDDIVLLFASPESKMAYCYKKSDLRRVVHRAYNINNIPISYIVIPHTGQAIINPNEILQSDKKAFNLQSVDASQYRSGFPSPYVVVWRNESIFENPPERGDDVVEEKTVFEPSPQYLEMEEKSRTIRERRARLGQNDQTNEENKAIIQRLYNRSMDLMDDYSEEYNLLKNNFREVALRGNEGGNIPVYNSRFDIPEIGWCILYTQEPNREKYEWYFNGVNHRDNDLPAILEKKGQQYTFYWIKRDLTDRERGPAILGTDIIGFFENGEMKTLADGTPSQISVERNKIQLIWQTPDPYIKVNIYPIPTDDGTVGTLWKFEGNRINIINVQEEPRI